MFQMILRLSVLFTLCVYVALASGPGCLDPLGEGDDNGEDGSAFEFSPLAGVELPSAFVFGPAAVTPFQLRNTGVTSLRVVGFTMGADCPDGLEVPLTPEEVSEGILILVGEEAGFEVHYEATAFTEAGACSTTPEFWVYGRENNGLPMQISYSTDEPECALTPGEESNFEIDFGTVPVDTQEERELTIANATPDALDANWFQYELKNPLGSCEAFEVGDLAGKVGPGRGLEPSSTIPVTFSPTNVDEPQVCDWELDSWTLEPDNVTRHDLARACWATITLSGTGVVTDPASITACKYEDLDGVLGGDTNPVSGWTVSRSGGASGTVSADTEAGGCYTWMDLEPGISYTVAEEDRAGWTPLTARQQTVDAEPGGSYAVDFVNTQVVPQWSECSPSDGIDRFGMFGLPDGSVYTVGAQGTVTVSRDGLCTWEAYGSGLGDIEEVDLSGLWVRDNEATIWAAGTIPPPPGFYAGTGAIVRLEGGLWSIVDEGLMDGYWSVWGSAPEDVWFGGTGVSTDFPNAKHWVGTGLETAIISDMGMTAVSGLHGTEASDVWAVLREGDYPAYRPVYHYDGGNWADMTDLAVMDEGQRLNGVYAVNGSGFYAVYAVGDEGTIYRYDGGTWHNESIVTTNDLHDAWVNPASGEAWIVGQGGSIYRKAGDAGATWEIQSVPSEAAGITFHAIDAAGTDLYVTGESGVTLRLGNGAG